MNFGESNAKIRSSYKRGLELTRRERFDIS